MFSTIKKSFSFLLRYKKSILYVFCLIVVFWGVRFPWNDFLTVLVRENSSSLGRQIDFEDLKIKIFPPGVQFDKVSLIYNNKKIEWDSLSVYMDWIKWLAFKKAFKFELQKDESRILVRFYKKTLEPTEDSGIKDLYFVSAGSHRFQLDTLGSFFYNNPLSGDLSFQSSFSGSIEDMKNIKADLKLNGEGIALSQYQWNSALGPVRFPSTQWKTVEADIELKDGELFFNKIELGGDETLIQARGSGAFRWSYGKFRLDSYNIELQMDISKEFQFGFLDIMFGAYKEDKDRFYRYRLRLIGEGNQVPSIEKLESF